MLPNLIIIGAPKAGTTSLHFYLSLHPEIAMTRQKELRYFWRDDWRERREWYERQFDADARVRGETTPAYAAYPHRPHVPERMHELVPDVKLIYLVRDPIDRLLSHWVQRRADGDAAPLERYMRECEQPDNPLVCPSRYWLQLERYLRFFDRSQLLVLDQHDLMQDRRAAMIEVFRFIGVDDFFESSEFEIERNTRADQYGPRRITATMLDRVLWPASRRVPHPVRDVVRRPLNRLLFRQIRERPILTQAMRGRLEVMFAPEMKALREFAGKPFASWSV